MPTKKGRNNKPVAGAVRRTKTAGQQVVNDLIAKFSEQAGAQNFKVTVADFIRLLQFEREHGQEGPKDVQIKWIEPAEESKS